MKLDGFLKGTGKIGSIVTSRVGGVTIAREYNPNVSNPNTQAQVDQRAKLKLMSQVAAALAPVIAIPKEGLKSSRNLFIKKNFDLSLSQNGVAQISYENLQLTAGNAGFPAIYAERSQQSGITVRLTERADNSVSRVVYIVYSKTSENTLQYMESVIVEESGADGLFPASMLYVSGDIVLFAYGLKDLNSKAKANYGRYGVSDGSDIASLVTSRKLSFSDYQFTETRGTTMFADENSTVVVGENQARVFVTAAGGGTVAGQGVYAIGEQVTVTASPAQNNTFLGWFEQGGDTPVSTQQSYTFTLEGQTDLIAKFQSAGAPVTYSVFAETEDPSHGTVSPTESQTVAAGESVTVTATAKEGWLFKGWYDGNGLRSASATYTFIPTENVDLIAMFKENNDE